MRGESRQHRQVLFAGTVTGGDFYTGGLCGQNGIYGEMAECYSIGAVTGGDYVGGLCGDNIGSIIGCYSTGAVTGNGQHVAGLCGYVTGYFTELLYSFWNRETSGQAVGYHLDASSSPRISNVVGVTTAQMQTQSTFTNAGWDFAGETANGMDDVWVMMDLPVFGWQKTLYGRGTAGNPYLIRNLYDFNEFCSDSSYWESGVYARLECDLDLGGITYTQAPIAGDTDTDSSFDGTRYNGIFDGGGHVISNLTVSGAYYCGLFGNIVASGTVSNLRLENVAVSATQRFAGGLCGCNHGSIRACYFDGTVTGIHDIGGLCGYNDGSISECYSTGAATGELYVGSLCGGNYGRINKCYSAGSVAGDRTIGGLCGSNSGNTSIISECYSTSTVTGVYDSIGGLCGWNDGSIIRCYAAGTVTGDYMRIGGLCGTNSSGSISECYSTGSVTGNYNIGGCAGVIPAASVNVIPLEQLVAIAVVSADCADFKSVKPLKY